MAPFLFLIVAECLAGLMRAAVSKQLFDGYRIGNGNFSVSVLQFTDDSLFVGNPSSKNILLLKSVLRHFELMSGLKVNFH